MKKLQIQRILYVAIAWTLLGAFLTFYDHFLLASHLSSGPGNEYTLFDALVFNLFAGCSGGLMGGFILLYINRKFRSRPYIQGLVVVVLSFVFIVSTITLITAAAPTLLNVGNPLSNPEAEAFFLERILTTLHLKNIGFWAIVVAVTMFGIQVSDKFGPGNLWSIVVGKYHLPKEENRIFMFLDLRSSTTIAERLGEERYHQLLQDVFADITLPIVNSKGKIYQYVGDEVVISWSADEEESGENCLRCFFDIRRELESGRERYEKKFGLMPEFKAGAHYGRVVAGEIGIIKRDITFSGDVLNTAARIQSQCGLLNSRFLISGSLRSFIDPDQGRWISESKGEIDLKGKASKLELIEIKEG